MASNSSSPPSSSRCSVCGPTAASGTAPLFLLIGFVFGVGRHVRSASTTVPRPQRDQRRGQAVGALDVGRPRIGRCTMTEPACPRPLRPRSRRHRVADRQGHRPARALGGAGRDPRRSASGRASVARSASRSALVVVLANFLITGALLGWAARISPDDDHGRRAGRVPRVAHRDLRHRVCWCEQIDVVEPRRLRRARSSCCISVSCSGRCARSASRLASPGLKPSRKS